MKDTLLLYRISEFQQSDSNSSKLYIKYSVDIINKLKIKQKFDFKYYTSDNIDILILLDPT